MQGIILRWKMDLALFQLALSYHWHGPNIKVLFKRSLTLLAGADEAVRIICSGFVFALLRRNFNMLSNILNAADFNLLALMLFCFHKWIIRFVFSFPVRLFMFLNGQSPAVRLEGNHADHLTTTTAPNEHINVIFFWIPLTSKVKTSLWRQGYKPMTS